ncbi:hypothetical protein RB195_011526 [Necator americanus]
MEKSQQSGEDRTEKATELLRLHLERAGTMDALTGWIKKIVEIPVDKRPQDALDHLKKNWNSWNGNIRSTAIKNALKNVQEELAEVLKENQKLKNDIAHYEEALLIKKVAALNASTKQKSMSSRKILNCTGKNEKVEKEMFGGLHTGASFSTGPHDVCASDLCSIPQFDEFGHVSSAVVI